MGPEGQAKAVTEVDNVKFHTHGKKDIIQITQD